MFYRPVNYKLITDNRFSIIARCILFLLYAFMNDVGMAYPSREKLLHCLGLTKTGFYPHYRQLEAGEMVKIERKIRKVNRYFPKWQKPDKKSKYGIVYKEIMVNPDISPTSKLLFVYITAFCPIGRSWEFEKAAIADDLKISAYKLNKSLSELENCQLIAVKKEFFRITITNTYLSESIRIPENDTTKTSVSESQTNKSENEPKLTDKEVNEIEAPNRKQVNLHYLRIILIKYITGKYLTALREIQQTHNISLTEFANQFLERYERKVNPINVRSISAYMRTCLIEFIEDYGVLVEDIPLGHGYTPTYNIAEYESTSVLDEMDEEELTEIMLEYAHCMPSCTADLSSKGK